MSHRIVVEVELKSGKRGTMLAVPSTYALLVQLMEQGEDKSIWQASFGKFTADQVKYAEVIRDEKGNVGTGRHKKGSHGRAKQIGTRK